MDRRLSLKLFTLSAVAVGAALAYLPATGAAERSKPDLKKIADAIQRNGKLPGREAYWQNAVTLHKGQKRTSPVTPLNKKAGGKSALAAGGRSSVTTVREEGLPPGFGKGFIWDRTDNEVLLVMFINAADPLGISIEGVQSGDQVQVMAASGIASFSKDEGNPIASSIVGLVAAGAKIVVGAEGAPEVIPAIDKAEEAAKGLFKATNALHKRRDAFGVDPSSGHKAKEEGGVLVCMPEAGGTLYSGDGDHKDRWIQPDGTRSDEHLPGHFNSTAFFPRQGFAPHNTRTARQTGPMYVLAWDWKFEDNAGFYKVFVKLTKGPGPADPGPILRKTPTKRPGME